MCSGRSRAGSSERRQASGPVRPCSSRSSGSEPGTPRARRCRGTASARVLREVDDRVRPLGRSQQEGVFVDVSDVEPGRIGDPRGRLVRNDHRIGKKPPSVPISIQLGPIRALGRVGCREDDRVELRGRDFGGLERDLGSRGVGHVPLQVPEAVVRRIQDPQAVRFGSSSTVGYAVPFTIGVSLNCSMPTEMSACREFAAARRTARSGTATLQDRRGCRPGRSWGSRSDRSWRLPQAAKPGPYIQRPKALMPLGSPRFSAGIYTWWYHRSP